MALSIKDESLDRQVRELARLAGCGLTDAVRMAVNNELIQRACISPEEKARRLRVVAEIQARVRKLPVMDARTPDEILGYDDNGLTT